MNRIFKYLKSAGAAMRLGAKTMTLFPSFEFEEPAFKKRRFDFDANGWETDGANLRGDWERVGDALRAAMKKGAYEQPKRRNV